MVTLQVLVHPLVTFQRHSPDDGDFILVTCKRELRFVLEDLALRKSVDTVIEKGRRCIDVVVEGLPPISREDVEAVLHFTGALAAQTAEIPLAFVNALGQHITIVDPARPSRARVHGTSTSVAAILLDFGSSLDVEQVKASHGLTTDQVAAAVGYASGFITAFQKAMFDRRYERPARHQVADPRQNVSDDRIPEEVQ